MHKNTFLNILKQIRTRKGARVALGVGAVSLLILYGMDQSLVKKYNALESQKILDRKGEIITLLPNAKGEYSNYTIELTQDQKKLLVQKEDQHFFRHPGVNPGSILRAVSRLVKGKTPNGSSTITQQLAKNLLGNENDRSLANKVIELFYTISLEVFHTKETILTMYINTVYMGNNIQGIGQASLDYFRKEPKDLDLSETMRLMATISSPSSQNPWKKTNDAAAAALAQRLGSHFSTSTTATTAISKTYLHTSPTQFELDSLTNKCQQSCVLTIDKQLTEKIRATVERNVIQNRDAGAKTAAVVVIKVPENEILAVVGSPNPTNKADGHSINMAVQPRPIGSTAKPFIYLEGFQAGLRPYTLVEDREYKFPIASGFALYPKNYDGLYHGTVTLHESLSNSYNVPTIKTLEHVGLSPFYAFLQQKLGFKPLQEMDSYQYGIALGGLEMDPLTLTHFFTLFPQEGVLRPLTLFISNPTGKRTLLPPMGTLLKETRVAEPQYVQLVNRVLNDRKSGVQQFGLKSTLNLSQDNYAVKTGTSRDYHDSWTVGYTPDFVVAVWLGNAENEPLKQLSGSSGAGKIWNETMELLLHSEYNHKTPLAFDLTKLFMIDGDLEIGLPDDDVAVHRNLLEEQTLILSPHQDDVIQYEPKTTIPLKATREAMWYVNETFVGAGQKIDFHPDRAGTYRIDAAAADKTKTIFIRVVN